MCNTQKFFVIARLLPLSVGHSKTTFSSDLQTTEGGGNSPSDGHSQKILIFCHTYLVN
jgi:hypothetical protein